MNDLMRIGEVLSILGVCRTTLYAWMEKGAFPKPIAFGPRMVRWKREDIESWIKSREAKNVG